MELNLAMISYGNKERYLNLANTMMHKKFNKKLFLCVGAVTSVLPTARKFGRITQNSPNFKPRVEKNLGRIFARIS